MKFAYACVFVFVTTIHIVYPMVEGLQQLQRSLARLSRLLESSAKVPTISTYKEFEKVVNEAYAVKNPDLLDRYEQTKAITTAKYLLSEFIKEGDLQENRSRREYIPFIAHVVQKVTEEYQGTNLNCVSLASGGLENELLLVRALRYAGYKTIRLIAIDIIYEEGKKKQLQDSFLAWCNKRNIKVSFERHSQLEDGITLELFADAHEYIKKVLDKNLPKNHLFIMIQPGNISRVQLGRDLIIDDINEIIAPNFLSLEYPNRDGKPYIRIYLPYNFEDSFIESSNIKSFYKEHINTSVSRVISKIRHAYQSDPSYQKKLMPLLVEQEFGVKPPPFQPVADSRLWLVRSNTTILFLDLIRHTAVNPKKPLAFETLDYFMRQITSVPDKFEDMYNLYKGVPK